jgi:aspartyl-tRNA synthetase
MADWQRTHTCGDLREADIGKTVVLNGWVNTYRAYNDQIFVDLRDRYGITQVVFEADDAPFQAAQEVRNEFVLSVRGKVRERLPDKHNPKLATGDIEVRAETLTILNRCPTPKFEVTEFPGEEVAHEDLRLEFRYLDLRRPTLQRTLAMRHRLNQVIRSHLDREGFLEVETPLLGRSTPEGARDYLVPSRVTPGSWYALPQSPQLYKQLLMVGGYDKYFQIARCLRDEDLRADRQPEFTQLDLEMSFVEAEDIFRVIEGLTGDLVRRCVGVEMARPVPRLQFEDVMRQYGSDKPDLRYTLEIVDVTDIARRSEFKVFIDAAGRGDVVRALNAKGAADKFSNTDLKPGGKLAEFVGRYGAKGLAWFKVEADKLVSSIEKFFPKPLQDELRQALRAEAGDVLLFVADKPDVAAQALGQLRNHLAAQLKVYTNWWERKAELDRQVVDEEARAKKERRAPRSLPAFRCTPEDFALAWVVDFPLFLWDEQEKRWVSNHHPFTSPRDEDLPLLESDPGKVRAKAYDLVLNGYEVGGGSIRIHNPDVQQRVFKVLGMSEEQARQRFGFLLDALKSGAPPHGGIALGLDRFAMILGGTSNIRDVIAFPKNQKARDLMTGAPAPVDAKQLKELGL